MLQDGTNDWVTSYLIKPLKRVNHVTLYVCDALRLALNCSLCT